MANIKVIGLTGGIACGKSSVGYILRQLGIKVIDADEIAHQIYQPGTQAYTGIIKEFGPDIIKDGGEINRQKLGEIVFKSKPARDKLERITHPFIIQKIDDLISLARLEEHRLLVIEIPLLFEIGMEGNFDYIWVVSSSPDKQVERLMKRNNLTREEAETRLSAQLPLSYKEGKADVIIYNNKELPDLEAEIKQLLEMMN